MLIRLETFFCDTYGWIQRGGFEILWRKCSPPPRRGCVCCYSRSTPSTVLEYRNIEVIYLVLQNYLHILCLLRAYINRMQSQDKTFMGTLKANCNDKTHTIMIGKL